MKADEIEEKISPYFLACPEVQAAYLFGSTAKGGAGLLSDIDLALLVDEAKIPGNLPYGYKVYAAAELMRCLQTDGVDLVILNESPLLLRFQVVRDGIVLHCKDEKGRVQFESQVMSIFLDEQYYFKRHAAANLERIAREGIL